MKAAELIITEARSRGLRHFFGIPGGGSPLDLMAAGQKLGVDFVNVSHESSAAIVAAYYGYLKGTAGLSLAIRGVGTANLVGGACNVHFERFPLVAICETCPIAQAQHEMVQHCHHDQLVSGITKYRATLSRTGSQRMVQEAFFRATDGRPGPCLLNFPSDLGEVSTEEEFADTSWKSVSPQGTELAAIKKLLKKSQRPVVLAGADVIRSGASNELLELVKKIEAAVLVTMDARGVFPENNPRWAGVYVGFFSPNLIETEVFSEADTVLIVGADALMTHSPWNVDLPTCELAVRSEYTNLSTAPIARANGDLRTALDELSTRSQPGFSEDAVVAMRMKIAKGFQRPREAQLAAQDVLEITRRLLPQDGILFSETGAYIGMLEHLWLVDRPGAYFGTSGGRTMGLMVPAILGGRLADGQKPMVGLGADGSLLMRLGELEVFARTGVAVPLIIINDQALGTMKSRQKSRGLPDYGLDFHPIDFSSVAQSFGLHGVKVETPEAFERELGLAFNANRSTVIDVRVDPTVYQDGFRPTIDVFPPSL